jgi:hypothetical protein
MLQQKRPCVQRSGSNCLHGRADQHGLYTRVIGTDSSHLSCSISKPLGVESAHNARPAYTIVTILCRIFFDKRQ